MDRDTSGTGDLTLSDLAVCPRAFQHATILSRIHYAGLWDGGSILGKRRFSGSRSELLTELRWRDALEVAEFAGEIAAAAKSAPFGHHGHGKAVVG